MSNSGLRFEVADPQAAHCLDREIVQFICVSTATDPANTFATIHGKTFFVFLNKRFIASLLDPTSDLIESSCPRICPPNGRIPDAGPAASQADDR